MPTFTQWVIVVAVLVAAAMVVAWLRRRGRRSPRPAEDYEAPLDPRKSQPIRHSGPSTAFPKPDAPAAASPRTPPMPSARPMPEAIAPVEYDAAPSSASPRGLPGAPESAGAEPPGDPEAATTASASRELGAPSPAPPAEAVQLGASAPAAVRPGDEFTARFVAYRASEEAEVGALLTQLSPKAEHRLGVRECQWQVGTKVIVRLSGRRLEVTPAEQSFVWEGRRALLEFDVAVAADAPEGAVVLKFDVLVDGIVVAGLRIDLQIAAQPASNQAPARATVQAARSAFASYSSKDRERVLDRLAAVRIATGLDVFLDCLALNPGEQWKPRLENEIHARDLFLLFWSEESAASKWVEWEWRTALAAKGRDAMQIHPLANGVKPPAELRDLHFGDVYMLVREATVAHRTPPAP